jgi:hypothetical protein
LGMECVFVLPAWQLSPSPNRHQLVDYRVVSQYR